MMRGWRRAPRRISRGKAFGEPGLAGSCSRRRFWLRTFVQVAATDNCARNGQCPTRPHNIGLRPFALSTHTRTITSAKTPARASVQHMLRPADTQTAASGVSGLRLRWAANWPGPVRMARTQNRTPRGVRVASDGTRQGLQQQRRRRRAERGTAAVLGVCDFNVRSEDVGSHVLRALPTHPCRVISRAAPERCFFWVRNLTPLAPKLPAPSETTQLA